MLQAIAPWLPHERPMRVRQSSASDLAAILAIGKTAPWDKSEYLQRQLSAGNIAVAEDERDVRGFIVWNREFFSLPFVWLVAVDPSCRRAGIASALFEYVERLCAGSRLYSSTNESHDAMHAFFKNRGYRQAGTADVDPGDPEIFYRIDLP